MAPKMTMVLLGNYPRKPPLGSVFCIVLNCRCFFNTLPYVFHPSCYSVRFLACVVLFVMSSPAPQLWISSLFSTSFPLWIPSDSLFFCDSLPSQLPVFLGKCHFAFESLELSWSSSSCFVYREPKFGVSNKSFISVSVSFCDFCLT